MLIPLGVLAVGAIFAGMVWYGPFFGSNEKVAEFFHLTQAEDHSAEHATAEPADHAPAPVETANADDGHSEAAATEGAINTNVPAPVGGAIYMHPDNHVLHDAHYAPVWVKLAPFFAMLAGLAVAWTMYIRNPGSAAQLAATQRPLYKFLLNKWYFDELYDAAFVRPARWIGKALWTGGDGRTIDGLINGLAMGLIPKITRLAGRVQSGYLFHYAFSMVLGLVGLLIWVMARSVN